MTTQESGAPLMPMVIGLKLARAREVISSAITDAQVTIQYSDWDAVPPGTVWTQEPHAGLEVTPGRQIRLGVATGPSAGDLSSSEP
jgi:beta-lactam-binding protein with PASTA domain